MNYIFIALSAIVGAYATHLLVNYVEDYLTEKRYHADRTLIDQITARYDEIMGGYGLDYRGAARLNAYLNAAHNGNHPMRLGDLLDAPEAQFMRETSGMLRDYEPTTDTFANGFIPGFLK